MHRLRGHVPELLVVLGALLGTGVIVAVLLTRHEERREARRPPTTTAPTSTSTTTAAPPPTTTTAPPPTAPGTPLDLRVASLSASSATLSWRTAVPTVGRVAVGTPALGPTRWLPP